MARGGQTGLVVCADPHGLQQGEGATEATLYDPIGREEDAFSRWQNSVRAVVAFVIGLVFVRLAGKRVFGKWGALEILLAVMIGSNLSRAITGGAPLAPALAATAVLVGPHTALVYGVIVAPALAATIPYATSAGR